MTPLTKRCPMFGDDCRHCSHETTTTGTYTKIAKNPVTGLFEPKGRGRTTIALGEYCNNACTWVRDLHVCPSRWALHRGVITELKCKTKPIKSKPMHHTVPKKSVVHTGQQKLFMR